MWLEDKNNRSINLEGSTHFEYSVNWITKGDTYVVRNYYSIAKNACFGELTHSLPSDALISGRVVIHFNNYYNKIDELTHDVEITESNIGTALRKEQFREMFDVLRNCLSKYVPHHSGWYLNQHVPVSNFEYENHDFVLAKEYIVVEFGSLRYYEIYFILNMYRRLVTFDTIRSNLAAYELAKTGWKKLSFVQLLLLTDWFNCGNTPSDSLIGMIYFSNLRKLNSLVTIASFKNIKNESDTYKFSGRYIHCYSKAVIGQDDSPVTGRTVFRDLAQKYHLPGAHTYRTFDDVCITEAKPEDCDNLKTIYMFLQKVIKQNNKQQ